MAAGPGTSCSVTSDGLTGGNLGYGLFNVQRHDFMHLKKSSQDQECSCTLLYRLPLLCSVRRGDQQQRHQLHDVTGRSLAPEPLGGDAAAGDAPPLPAAEPGRGIHGETSAGARVRAKLGCRDPGREGEKGGGGRVWRCGDVVVEWELVWRISARWTGVWTSCGTKWSAVTQTSGSS